MNDNNDVKYSIIREQGEFMDPVELNETDNKTVNEQSEVTKDKK